MRTRTLIGIFASFASLSALAGVYQTEAETDRVVKKEAANTPVKIPKELAEKPVKQDPKATPTPNDGKK